MTGIVAALSAVMEDVGAVRKADRNEAQRFVFRGIDAVVNAVSPALRRHGVVVTPALQSIDYATVEVGKNRTPMGHVRVTVAYTFTADDGSSLTATVPGEAMDSGDKATAKAMSVAFRTALLQALCLPTDEADPDATSYERSGHRGHEEQARDAQALHDRLTGAETVEVLDAVAREIAGAGLPPAAIEWLRSAYRVRRDELA